jgi:hypothetical protein
MENCVGSSSKSSFSSLFYSTALAAAVAVVAVVAVVE